MPHVRQSHAIRRTHRRVFVRRAACGAYPDLPCGNCVHFEDFPDWDPTIDPWQPTEEQFRKLGIYLQRYYGVWKCFIVRPFIFFCMPNRSSLAPPMELSPFMIAGLLVIWMYRDCKPFHGLRLWHYIRLEKKISMDFVGIGPEDGLVPYKIPSTATLQGIGQGFPEATHISFYNSRIIIELPKTSPQDYRQRLQALPTIITGSIVKIYYSNGQLRLPIILDPESLMPNPDTIEYGGEFGEQDDSHWIIGPNDPSLRLRCLGKRVGLLPMSDRESQQKLYKPCQTIFINSKPEQNRSYLCLSPIWMWLVNSDDDSSTLVNGDDGAIVGPEEAEECANVEETATASV